jgi:hypothetical protein
VTAPEPARRARFVDAKRANPAEQASRRQQAQQRERRNQHPRRQQRRQGAGDRRSHGEPERKCRCGKSGERHRQRAQRDGRERSVTVVEAAERGQ